MSQTDNDKKLKKEAMKKLRAARKETIKAATIKMKEQKKVIKTIMEQMGDKDMTVPEISEGTGIPTSEVLWYLATMKKYGKILEVGKDDSYYRYQLVVDEQADAAA